MKKEYHIENYSKNVEEVEYLTFQNYRVIVKYTYVQSLIDGIEKVKLNSAINFILKNES